MLGKPIAECSALGISISSYAFPGGAVLAWQFFTGHRERRRHRRQSRREADTPMCELGWKSMGVLELTALPSIDKALWVPTVQQTDVLLVNGGDPMYLCYWMQQSGLADLLPTLSEMVYVGLSAGSMIITPNIGEDFVNWKPPTGGDKTLGLVDFAIFPHLDHEMLPHNTLAHAERWAAGMTVPVYGIDDQTAIQVTDGEVKVVSEGQWKLFER